MAIPRRENLWKVVEGLETKFGGEKYMAPNSSTLEKGNSCMICAK